MDHESRLNLLLKMMAEEGLETIIGFSPAAHHVDFGDAVALLSGVKPLGPSFAVLRGNGELDLVISPSWDLKRAEAQAKANNITATNDLAAALIDSLNGASDPATIGTVDMGKMPHGLVDGFLGKLGGTPKLSDGLVFGAAARKTDGELANAREATRIAEQTYTYMLDIAEVGMPECHLAASLKSYSRAIGADDNFMMFHAEGHPLAVQPSGERKLEKGDLILAEITPSYGGQFAQICRTACLGDPTDEQVEKYDLVVRAMGNGISKAKPGVPMKDICLGVDEVLRDAGYGEYCEPPYMNRRGHGLGITSVQPGNVSLKNETMLEDGMFFVVHPNQYIPEVGYLLCGEPIIVTSPSAEIVTAEGAALGSITI